MKKINPYLPANHQDVGDLISDAKSEDLGEEIYEDYINALI